MISKNKIIVAFAGLLLLTVSHLSAQLKVITVDMDKILSSYYKVEEAENKLKEAAETADQQLQEMRSEGQKMVENLNQIMEQINNPALNEQAKQEANQDARAKQEEIQRLQQDIQQFSQNTTRSLQQRRQTHMQYMVEEIMAVVRRMASEMEVDLVFDTSRDNSERLTNVLYANPDWDISDQVLETLNADKPAEE